MTRKDRILAAMTRKSIDRCPYVTYNIQPYTDNYHTRESSYAEILKIIGEKAGVAAKVGPAGEDMGATRYVERTETRTERSVDLTTTTTIVHTPKGDLTGIFVSSEDRPGRQTRHFLESDDDVEKYLSLPYEEPEYDVSGVDTLCRAVGDRGVVLTYLSAPTEQVVPLFHYEDFCMRTLTDLPLIKRMMGWAFERCLQNAKLLVRACAGLDCVFHVVGPEYITPPMLPPALFAELVTPDLRRLVEVVHEAGFLVAVHCHGRVREAVPELIKAGVDMLEPIEPIPQGDIDLPELLDTYGRDIAFMGHIQDQDLYTAPPGHMASWVEQIARTVNGRSGYIMSPTCTPFDFPCTDTYQRNYIEWMEAAERALC